MDCRMPTDAQLRERLSRSHPHPELALARKPRKSLGKISAQRTTSPARLGGGYKSFLTTWSICISSTGAPFTSMQATSTPMLGLLGAMITF